MKIYRFMLSFLTLLMLAFMPVAAQVQQIDPAMMQQLQEYYGVSTEEITTMQSVLVEGYENYKTHKANGSLNETELQIQSLLDERIPALERKMQKQMELMQEEYSRLLEQTIRNAGEFSLEKLQKAQEEVTNKLQAQYEQVQLQNMQDFQTLLTQLLNALIKNQNSHPNYTPKNEELALSFVVGIYTSHYIEQMSPEEQQQLQEALQQLMGGTEAY